MKPDRINRERGSPSGRGRVRRFAGLTASLTAEEWAMPTDCTAWDVRKMALHVLGSADAQASVREFVHQMRRGMPLNKQIDSHHWVDGMNELQIRERQHLSNAELVVQLKDVGPKAVKGRWGTPPPMRYLPVPFGPPVGWEPLKYLLDVGFTRDVWCHRIDICCATGRPMHLTADHDGRLVADIVGRMGIDRTVSRSIWSSKARREESSPRVSTANESRSTPSTSSAPSPAGSPAPACSATPPPLKETVP